MTDPSHRQLKLADPWSSLRAATSARIALGRAGGSLPTDEWLDFQAAHAAARDAVHAPFDAPGLAAELSSLKMNVVIVDSRCQSRQEFLARPDWGRRLTDHSREELERLQPECRPDLAILVSDGLSALAAARHSPPLLEGLLPKLESAGWTFAPLVVARFGRVALGDDVGRTLSARLVLMLLGERPGLGSPDSLGAYLTFDPKLDNTDANRNCVSNIRPEGLAIAPAVETLYYLLTEARKRRLSGTALKDDRARSHTDDRTLRS